MPATDAQIAANRRNAQLSSGPKTEAGKAQSRRNALKHGLTAEVVIPEAEAAEVERKFRLMRAELRPSTELADELVRQIAKLSVRLRRCEIEEAARLSDRVRKAIDGAVVPEGAPPEEAAEIKAHAADLALLDPSPEAERARKYEAAAQRGFFKAINEFRRVERESDASRVAAEARRSIAELGSFLNAGSIDEVMAPKPGETIRKPPMPAQNPAATPPKSDVGGVSYVPIAVGKPA